jgi:hypothetical protein
MGIPALRPKEKDIIDLIPQHNHCRELYFAILGETYLFSLALLDVEEKALRSWLQP